MRDKVATLKEAVSILNDGDNLAMTTSVLDDAPMAFLREVVRSRRKDLSLTAVTGGGFNLDLLIGAGIVSSLDTCYVTLDSLGPAPSFQRVIKSGTLDMKDNTCGVMYSMVQAAAMGAPFVPVRGLFGTDILKHRNDFKEASNPFVEGEDVVFVPALKPDVAAFHGLVADKWGNAITPPGRDDLLLAQASKHVVVTAEEIVNTRLHPPASDTGTYIPSIFVEAVVSVPHGAHPTGLWHRYDPDVEHLKRYIASCQEDDVLARYLDRYIYSVRDHRQYLDRVGLSLPREMAS